MSAKHTPGPWLIERDGRITSANGWMLASAHPTRRYPDAKEEREPGESWSDAYERLEPERNAINAETEANARLIAAAPELLEALNDMLAVHGVRWENVRGNNPILRSWVELSDKARAAIAKATGGQQ